MRTDAFYDVTPGYEVVVSSPSRIGAFHRFETAETMVQGAKVIRDLTGVEPVFGKVSFSYPEPPHRALYEECLKCPLEFDAPQTVVRILKPNLDAPIRTMNEEMFSICAEHCRQVMSSLTGAGLLRSRLRSMFLATPGRLPNLEQAGIALGMSISTLCRQLDDAGQSYQAIKDEFRYDLAREYLRSGHMSPKQVAYLLGFTSPSTFSRAFKAWAGQTVGQFLKSEAA
jgi:AraC-like DNA-binding protein